MTDFLFVYSVLPHIDGLLCFKLLSVSRAVICLPVLCFRLSLLDLHVVLLTVCCLCWSASCAWILFNPPESLYVALRLVSFLFCCVFTFLFVVLFVCLLAVFLISCSCICHTGGYHVPPALAATRAESAA